MKDLPAARLGQRAESAFVGTPAREAACSAASVALCQRHLNNLGFFAMLAGELSTATRVFDEVIAPARADDSANLGRQLRNLSQCHAALGQPEYAAAAATEARDRSHVEVWASLCHLGIANDLAGRATDAERNFDDADRLVRGGSPGHHLIGMGGAAWASFLLRTGRAASARRLTEQNRTAIERAADKITVSIVDRILGLCDLSEGEPRAAGPRFDTAIARLRAGEAVTELVVTLPDLAEQRRQIGFLDEAELACGEAIALAGPRELVPAHIRALAVRARVRGDRFAAEAVRGELDRGRDDADQALRLATQRRQLPWHELDALEAHAHLDRVVGVDGGWQARAETLRTKLVPLGLDPDPLTTIDAEVAAAAAAAKSASQPLEEETEVAATEAAAQSASQSLLE